MKNFISHQEEWSTHIFKITVYQINTTHFKTGLKKRTKKEKEKSLKEIILFECAIKTDIKIKV